MSGFKGQVDLAILIMVAGLIIFLVVMIGVIPLLTEIIGISNEVEVLVQSIDEGTKMVSFMQLHKENMTYGEILGNLRTANRELMSQESSYLTRTLEDTGLKVTVYDERASLLFGERETAATYLAMPGRLVGRVRIQ